MAWRGARQDVAPCNAWLSAANAHPSLGVLSLHIRLPTTHTKTDGNIESVTMQVGRKRQPIGIVVCTLDFKGDVLYALGFVRHRRLFVFFSAAEKLTRDLF